MVEDVSTVAVEIAWDTPLRDFGERETTASDSVPRGGTTDEPVESAIAVFDFGGV